MRDCSSSSSSSDACAIIDKQLMVRAINIAAICRACRDPKSRLSLMFSNRKGPLRPITLFAAPTVHKHHLRQVKS